MLSEDDESKHTVIRGLGSYETKNDTNQRLEFDIHDSTLFVGGQDCVRIYDLLSMTCSIVSAHSRSISKPFCWAIRPDE